MHGGDVAVVRARYRVEPVAIRRSGSTEAGVSLDTGDELLQFAPDQARALASALSATPAESEREHERS